MNHPKSPNSQLLQFMLRAQQLARQDVKTDKGYAMMMTSIITIMLFSLMGAFLTMTNLAKSSTDAYIDGNNTFFAAEGGLNQRAQELRARFENYNSPSDGATTVAEKTAAALNIPATMTPCYSKAVISSTNLQTTNDFECRNFPFKYNNNIAKTAGTSANSVVLSEADNNSSTVNYTAFTFVSDKTNYDPTSTPPAPIPAVVATGPFTGLNAQEYKYTVNATAAKANNNTGSQVGESGDNKTVLQMDFKSRTIPLFQFGAFYAGDLELNPSPNMTFNGRIHSNQNVYLTAGNGNNLTLNNAIISAVTSINTGNPSLANNYSATGTVQIQTNAVNPAVLASLPSNATPSTVVPIPSTSFSTTYNSKLATIPNALTVPPVSFLGKVDATRSDGIGEYYGKADLRLEMFPARAVPFTLQVIKRGTTATTTCNVAPFSGTVSTERAGFNTANCNDLSEGQLRSLMQPVLVRPRSDNEYKAFCNNTNPNTNTILDTTTNTTTTPVIGTPPQVGTAVTISNTDLNVRERILDALALTLAAQTTPVKYSDLSNSLSPTAQDQFKALLTNIPGLSATDNLDTLKSKAPRDIAAISSTTTNDNTTKSSCFRPAPIQALFNPGSLNTATIPTDVETNFNDRRENRYIRMLQTNIESLTLWNRDGLFVPGAGTFAANVAALPTSNFTLIDSTTKLWDSTQQQRSSGNDVLFTKAAAVTTALVYNPTTKTFVDSPLSIYSFRTMGLAASDRTEGGLVLYATINKTNYPYLAAPIATGVDPRQSRYGFAFNDGAILPAPLTIATDQPLYSQGDWNIVAIDKQPASFLADTIAILSNSCLNTTGDAVATPNSPASLRGQLNCGVLPGIIANAATPTEINAAFLAHTDTSIPGTYYSGGLNNYMRILEVWTGQAMKYTGSFVSLGAPLEVSGRYRACDGTATSYACPPVRNWSYDTSFNSYQGLPPLPPKVIELQQDSFRRKYN